MNALFARTNQALQINPPAGQQSLSTHGSDWLWAVTAIFVFEFVSRPTTPASSTGIM